MQVMPDGCLTVIQESSEWMSLRWAHGCQTGWYRRSNYYAFVPVKHWDKSVFFINPFVPVVKHELGNVSQKQKEGFNNGRFQKNFIQWHAGHR